MEDYANVEDNTLKNTLFSSPFSREAVKSIICKWIKRIVHFVYTRTLEYEYTCITYLQCQLNHTLTH